MQIDMTVVVDASLLLATQFGAPSTTNADIEIREKMKIVVEGHIGS